MRTSISSLLYLAANVPRYLPCIPVDGSAVDTCFVLYSFVRSFLPYQLSPPRRSQPKTAERAAS